VADITVYGAPWCPDCRRSKQFLAEQRIPYEWVDIDHEPRGAEIVREKNSGRQLIPTIVFADDSFLAEPSNDELARKLGLTLKAERSFYDLIIIGGGPAGLTAAIYGAREGIDCLVIEKSGFGGQAGVTERIDNYPGFPEGIRGEELASRFVEQCRRNGVEMLSAVGASSLRREGHDVGVMTDNGNMYWSHSAIIATGSRYRRLEVPGEAELIGAGIHFCATCDGPFYKGSDELLVIGGNSGIEEASSWRIHPQSHHPRAQRDLRCSALLRRPGNTPVSRFSRISSGRIQGPFRACGPCSPRPQDRCAARVPPRRRVRVHRPDSNTAFLRAPWTSTARFHRHGRYLPDVIAGRLRGRRRSRRQYEAVGERRRRVRQRSLWCATICASSARSAVTT
jgi:glutaredoxin